MNHKLTKQVKQELVKVANQLPVPKYEPIQIVTGAEILKNWEKYSKYFKDGLPKDFSELSKYKLRSGNSTACNHVKRLQKVFQNEGRLGVLKYIKPYCQKEKLEELNQEIQKLSA